MAIESKLQWTDWVLLCVLCALCVGSMFFTKTAVGTALIVLGLTALNGEIWPRIGRAFLRYNEQIKMMPHM